MARYINGQEITAYGFAFDGCHKFYLIETPEESEEMYNLDYRLYAIDGLPRAWADSCPLRFISSADLTKNYVPQCTPAHFDGDWDIDVMLKWELDELEREQIEANKED